MIHTVGDNTVVYVYCIYKSFNFTKDNADC